MCCVFIIEIILQCIGNISVWRRTASSAVASIIHVNRHAAVVHQCGHGCNFFCWRFRKRIGILVCSICKIILIIICHIIPIVRGSTKVGIQGLSIPSVGMRANTSWRIAPIFHDLCHGCGYATSVCVSIRAIRYSGAKVVVVLVLVPLGLNQRSNRHGRLSSFGVALGQVFPHFCDFVCGSRSVVDGRLDFIAVALQPPSEVFGHIFGIKLISQRIAQDRLHTVVCCHYNEAWIGVKNVKIWKARFIG